MRMSACRCLFFFFSSRRRHTRWTGDWSSDVCSSDLDERAAGQPKDQAGQQELNKSQEQAAGETEKLGKDVEQAAKESSSPAEGAKLEEAAQMLDPEASKLQRQAEQPQDSESGQTGPSSQAGHQASESLSRAAQS